MNRVLCCGFLVTICFVSSQLSFPALKADDAKPKKDVPKKNSKEDSTDKKAGGVKRAQTTFVRTVTAKITKVDDAMLSLEANKVTLEDVLIAEDVKVRLPAEQEFDSKGKPKPSKPDPNDPDRKLGGTKGSKDDLREGQQVVVKIGKHNKKLVATVILILPQDKK